MTPQELEKMVTDKVTEAANTLKLQYENIITSLQTQLRVERDANAKLREGIDDLEEKYKSLQAGLVVGKGSQITQALKPEDLAEFRVARLQAADLGEVIAAEAASKGMTEDGYIKASLKGYVA